MSSVLRHSGFQSATQRPMVGDTKTSMVRSDHIGWLLCDGRPLDATEYRTLFAVLGYDFGGSAGTFFLPDARGHVMGLINQPNEYTATPRTDVSEWADGDVSGFQTHTLTIAEMPAHMHGNADVSGDNNGNGYTTYAGVHSHTGTTNSTDGGNTSATEVAVNTLSDVFVNNSGSHTHTFTTDPSGNHRHQTFSTGGSQPHNNMQPTVFLGNLFIYGGRVNHNVTGFNGSTTPTANPSYYPPAQSKRLY